MFALLEDCRLVVLCGCVGTVLVLQSDADSLAQHVVSPLGWLVDPIEDCYSFIC